MGGRRDVKTRQHNTLEASPRSSYDTQHRSSERNNLPVSVRGTVLYTSASPLTQYAVAAYTALSVYSYLPPENCHSGHLRSPRLELWFGVICYGLWAVHTYAALRVAALRL